MSTRRRTRVQELSPPRSRPSRSPARTRKISPARKSPPARQIAPKPKSPARKSPSRKLASKYPARKSPARTVKETKEPIEPEAKVTIPKSPAKRLAIQTDASARLDDISTIFTRTTRSKRSDYSVKDVIFSQRDSTPEKNGVTDLFGLRNRGSVEEAPYTPRRSSRLREFIDVVPSLPDIRRSVSKSVSKHSRTPSKSVSKSLDTYSDDENSVEENLKERVSTQSSRKLSTPLRTSVSNIAQVARQWEFGGRVGTAVLILLIPLTVISILTSCMKSCSIQTLLNFSPFRSLSLWFSVPTSALIVAQILIQAMIAVFPYLGPKTDGMDNTGRKYCFNAFLSSFIVVNLVYQLDYWQIINKDLVLQEYLKLATASYIFALILSITLYVKSRKLEKDELNPYGNTGYRLYDFFIGREIHPSFKNVDVKLWISRICNINTLVLSLLIFTRAIKIDWTGDEVTLASISDFLTKLHFEISNPTVLVFSMMQIIYTLNYIVKEYRVTSTFYWQSEGVGYMQTVSSVLYPFYFTSISKHIADTGLTLSTNVLVAASLVFLLGYCLMLVSNDIKYEFRRNPLQPSLAYLESMITFNGKRLITSHIWGNLRHPNYAGDILIHIALALPGLLAGQIVAASPALITILVLLHRAWRDDARCQRRYGSAWSRYIKKVPSVIIPKATKGNSSKQSQQIK